MIFISIFNLDLIWEILKKFDIGFDLFLINCIYFIFDYYNEEMSDVLFEVLLFMIIGMFIVY